MHLSHVKNLTFLALKKNKSNYFKLVSINYKFILIVSSFCSCEIKNILFPEKIKDETFEIIAPFDLNRRIDSIKKSDSIKNQVIQGEKK
jgi:hypothetical protein